VRQRGGEAVDLKAQRVAQSLGWLTLACSLVCSRASLGPAAGRAAGPEASPPPETDDTRDEETIEVEEATDAYDPWEGMDRDGRIVAVKKPEQLPNPERWRYIPEGRIKPGNVFQRLLVSSFIAPFIFRDSDVGTGFGIALTDVDFRQKRRREFLGAFLSYTTKGQQKYSLVWRRWLHHVDLPEGGVLQEERSFWRARASYSKTLTRRFFGIGPDTDESDETSYQDKAVYLSLGVQSSFPEPGSNLVWELGTRAELHNLGDGSVSGAPDTSDEFPLIFADAENRNMGWLVSTIRWDTRDSTINPYRGWMVGADLDGALAQTDGQVGGVARVFGTKVFPVPGVFHDGGDSLEENPPTDVLAFGFTTQQAFGDLPFYSLPTLGGEDTMRGYIEGRFYDDASWLIISEYRVWVVPRGFKIPFTKTIRIERVGVAFFYEVGAVADDWPALFSAKVRHSYGVGLRMTLERTAPFRIDLGFSEDGLQVSLGFGLTF
jgi:hypothetical protein